MKAVISSALPEAQAKVYSSHLPQHQSSLVVSLRIDLGYCFLCGSCRTVFWVRPLENLNGKGWFLDGIVFGWGRLHLSVCLVHLYAASTDLGHRCHHLWHLLWTSEKRWQESLGRWVGFHVNMLSPVEGQQWGVGDTLRDYTTSMIVITAEKGWQLTQPP